MQIIGLDSWQQEICSYGKVNVASVFGHLDWHICNLKMSDGETAVFDWDFANPMTGPATDLYRIPIGTKNKSIDTFISGYNNRSDIISSDLKVHPSYGIVANMILLGSSLLNWSQSDNEECRTNRIQYVNQFYANVKERLEEAGENRANDKLKDIIASKAKPSEKHLLVI